MVIKYILLMVVFFILDIYQGFSLVISDLNLKTKDEVINWCNSNLKYVKDDPWTPAIEIEKILESKRGDSHNLSGLVCELLRSVDIESKIAVVKKYKFSFFVIFREDEKWEVFDGKSFIIIDFDSLEEVKKHFKVDDFYKVYDTFDDFKVWYNAEVKRKEKIKNTNKIFDNFMRSIKDDDYD